MNYEDIRTVLHERSKAYDAAKKAFRLGTIKRTALREIKHQYKVALVNFGHALDKQYPAPCKGCGGFHRGNCA